MVRSLFPELVHRGLPDGITMAITIKDDIAVLMNDFGIPEGRKITRNKLRHHRKWNCSHQKWCRGGRKFRWWWERSECRRRRKRRERREGEMSEL
jgi:hypothetical protein